MSISATISPRAAVELLLTESIPSARERERSAFDELTGSLRDSIVLAGAGGLGRRCLAGLRHQGVEPIAFTDNNPALWGTPIDGLEVLPPEQAARRLGRTAVFVVTIWGAHSADRMNHRQTVLRSLGCECVTGFEPLFWKYPEGILPHYASDLPHKVLQRATDVLNAFDLWADDRSRCEYLAQLKWRLFGNLESLPPPERGGAYFSPDFIQLHPAEVYVDCGAFDGDTIKAFLAASNSSFRKILAFEPDPINFETLRRFVTTLPSAVQARITLEHAAVAAQNGKVRFSAQGSLSSRVGEGEEAVEAVGIDSRLDGVSPTFIKMDIEGAEPDALLGAENHIRNVSPTLAICCYHSQDHLWSIPLLINSLRPDYKFYLRAHDLEAWDLVCYAIPPSRLPLETRRNL